MKESGCETISAVAPPSLVQASLHLDFERDEANGRTILASSAQEPPLRVVRAFPLEDGAALVHLHNVSGGLLGGDCLDLSVRLGARTEVQLTTTGATRVYRPRSGSSAASQATEISLGETSLLEYLPDPLIPFAGARFSQRTTIHLDAGAGLFWWEILAPGREARGEVFEYERVEMLSRVIALGRPIAAEHIRLEPRARMLSSPVRLGSYRYYATFYVCRVGLDAAAWLRAEQHLREAAREFTKPERTLWGISTLVAHGLVVRCLARHGHDMLPGLQALWRAAKLLIYDRNAVLPRKVQ
jgi:urease accessory protein